MTGKSLNDINPKDQYTPCWGAKGNPPSELTLDSPWVTYILPGVKDTRSKIIIVNITKRGFPHTFKYTHSNQIDIP